MLTITCALLVAGCASITNPATVGGVYQMDALVGVAASALKGYRSLCIQHQPAVYPKCRTVMPLLQNDLRIAQGQVTQAIAFVRANPSDTVGLTTLVSQAQASVSQLQTDLKSNGVQ